MRIKYSVLLALAGLTSTCATAAPMATFEETFATEPAARGWHTQGERALFNWDAAGQGLDVTWDSSKTNSFFYRSLGTVLARDDDFSLSFDLQLRDVWAANAFEVAVGFVRLAEASRPDFYRGSGADSPNLVEFDYFPDTGFGATVSPAITSSNSSFATGFTWPLEIVLDSVHHVELRYAASNQTLVTTLTRNGEALGPIKDVKLGADFSDFRVDAVAVCSYSEAGQEEAWKGQILAHGRVDNLVVTLPPPPLAEVAGQFSGGRWEVQFSSRANWTYTLEGTSDFKTWTSLASAVGNGMRLTLRDGQLYAAQFYRIRAERP
jgi:hypothetical protein